MSSWTIVLLSTCDCGRPVCRVGRISREERREAAEVEGVVGREAPRQLVDRALADLKTAAAGTDSVLQALNRFDPLPLLPGLEEPPWLR